jgi:GNAT superfamily N-acetyltransferase
VRQINPSASPKSFSPTDPHLMESGSNPYVSHRKDQKMKQSFSLEQATQSDIPELLELLKILFEIENEFRFDPERQAAGLRLLIDSDTSAVFLCREENSSRILAMATVQLLISTAEGGLSAQIEDVVVLPGSRKMGIGSRLLEECRAWSIERGARRMQLSADDRNVGATNFYTQNGWLRSEMRIFRKEISSEK